MQEKTINKAVIDRLNYFMGKKNISQYRLAEISCVPYPTLKSIMQRRTTGISLKTIIMLAAGLEITPSEFLNDNSFLIQNLDIE